MLSDAPISYSGHFDLPPYIAICGNPESGKSLVQMILQKSYGVQPVDDGYALREYAVNNLGLTWDQVSTQEGKREKVKVLGRVWEVREILGEVGKQLEDLFGEHIMPLMAVNRIKEKSARSHSFGSVRKTQGYFFRERGGIVLGIRNPNAPMSKYAFDWFDPDAVTHWIDNDGLARGLSVDDARSDLEEKINVIASDYVKVVRAI